MVCHEGNDRQCHQQRGHERGGNGEAEPPDGALGVAADEHDGQQHGHRGEDAGGDGQRDLVGALQRSLLRVRFVHLAVPSVYVLQRDNGRIDHDADGDDEAGEGDHVQREGGEPQHHEAEQERERYAYADNQGGAHVRQEEEDDEDGQHDGLDDGVAHAVQVQLDERRLVLRDVELYVRVFRLQAGHVVLDAVDGLDGAPSGRADDAQRDGFLAVAVVDGPAVLLGQLDLRQVGYPQHTPPGAAHRQAAYVLQVLELSGRGHQVFALSGVDGARGRADVLLRQRADDLVQRGIVRGQAVAVNADLHLGLVSAEHIDVRDAFQTEYAVLYLVLGQQPFVRQGLPAVLCRAEGQRQQRARAGLRQLVYLWFAGGVGQVGPDARQGILHVQQSHAGVLGVCELHHHGRHLVPACAAQVLQPAYGIQFLLNDLRDVVLHVGGAGPRLRGDDDHLRRRRFREQVHGRVEVAHDAHGGNQQGEGDDGVGICEGEPGGAHLTASTLSPDASCAQPRYVFRTTVVPGSTPVTAARSSVWPSTSTGRASRRPSVTAKT